MGFMRWELNRADSFFPSPYGQVSRQSDPTVHAEDCEPQLGEGGYQASGYRREGRAAWACRVRA